ncbi:MAG: ABC transporter permease DevC [Myxococcota bacterium]|jgi:putative ABC transport system permease protein|nr:ABC transporter permease DevC [Myxococcota bacterium]
MLKLMRAVVFSFRLLMHERGRLIASVGGVTFALLLMLLQIGFRNALLDSAIQLLREVDADILVINKEKDPFLARNRMHKERLYQALSVEGVESASPLWIALEQWKNLEEETLHPIRVIGFNPREPTFLIDEVNENVDKLNRIGTAFLDSHARDSYGKLPDGIAQVSLREIEIVGSFPLGTDFEVDGSLLVSDETFFELTRQSPDWIEIALLRLKPGAEMNRVLENLALTLPGDVRAFSKAQLIDRDLDYWRTGTPISVILLVGVALGFAVGVVICYQILYTEVLDHLAEFATLKAMGYGDSYIQFVVMVESVLLSALGFVPSLVLGSFMLAVLGWSSGLPAGISLGDALNVGLLAVSMCTLAGTLALRKVRNLEPAELF